MHQTTLVQNQTPGIAVATEERWENYGSLCGFQITATIANALKKEMESHQINLL
jgi:hypothetical protein